MESDSSDTSRKIKSFTWAKAKKLSSFSNRDLGKLPHTNSAAVIVGSIVLTITRISTIFTSVKAEEYSKSIRSSVNRWFFEFLQDKLTIRVLQQELLMIIAWFLAIAVLVKGAFIGYLLWLNYTGRAESDMAKNILYWMILLFWFDTQVIPVLLLDLSVHMSFTLGIIYIFVAVMVVIGLLAEMAVGALLAYDFAYFKSNLVQGRKVSHAMATVLLALLSSLVYFATRPDSTVTTRVISSLCHVGCALLQISLRLKWDVLFYRPTVNFICLWLETFYFWMAMIHALTVIAPSACEVLDLDYLTLLLFPLLGWILHSLLARNSKMLLQGPRFTSLKKQSTGERIYFYERLYYNFLHQSEPQNRACLYASMCEHMRSCSDPYCLCYLGRIPFNPNVGHQTSLHAREIFKAINQTGKGTNQNRMTLFDDLATIETMRKQHNSVISIKVDQASKSLKISNEKLSKAKEAAYFLNLESPADFTTIMSAFLRKLVNNKGKGEKYPAVVSNLSFLYSEYNNPIAMLVLAYEYVYSKDYLKEASLVRNAILQNFIEITKQNLKLAEATNLSTHPVIEAVNLAKILNYRKRVHELRFIVQDLTVQKVELYSILAQKVMDFKELTTLGQEIYKKTVKTQREIDHLISVSKCNIKLAKLGVLFEMCVLERPVVSSNLRKCFKEAYFDVKNRVGSLNSASTKFKFSPFNSSNVIIFVRNYDNAFRICKHTQNAVHLFGVSHDILNGSRIDSFMPKHISKIHDRFVLSYLNGKSRMRHQGKLYVPVMNRQGTMRSTMFFIKPEFQFFDEVYLAGLVSIRKKNRFPILYTNEKGAILGANKQALKILANNSKLEESSLFAMLPRLFDYYFPNTADSHSDGDGGDTFGEKFANHGNTVNDGDFGETSDFEDDEDIVHSGDLRSKTSMELFLFQMMYKTGIKALGSIDLPPLHIRGPEESYRIGQTCNSKALKFQTQKLQSLSSSDVVAQFDVLSKIIAHHRALIAENLSKIFKTRVEIETNRFQRRVILREISFESIHRTRSRVQMFFKAFTGNNSYHLADILTVSPESLNSLYKLCTYRLKLRELKEEAGITVDDDVASEVFKNGVMQAMKIAPDLKMQALAVDSPVISRLETEYVDKQYSSIEVITSPEENNNLITKSDLPHREQKGASLGHAKMTPNLAVPHKIQSINEAPTDHWQIANQESLDADGRGNNLLLREKIHKYTHMIALVKRDLEKDLDSKKTRKLADLIYASLVSNSSFKEKFTAVQSLFVKGGSRFSSRESGLGDTEFIEGKSLQIENSVSSGQNTNDEIHVEYSDPFKSKVENDQPSTFLNSSSKVSVKTSQDANLIRSSIKKSSAKLIFRKWEYLMFASALIFMVLKIIFKFTYDNALVQIYEYEESVSLIANILRPSSYIYKESLKGWIQQYHDFNFSKIPGGKLFFEDQLEHYRARLIVQKKELLDFFSEGLDIPYTFNKLIPEKPISIFSMTMTIIDDYLKLILAIQSMKSQDDRSYILNNLPFWDQMTAISREVFDKLYRHFKNQDASRSDKLMAVYLYLSLNYSMNGLIQILMVCGTVYIVYLIDLQLRQAADIILRIDKWQFYAAIKKFSRVSNDADERGDLRQAVLDHVRQQARIMETETNLLGGDSKLGPSKMTKTKNRGKKKNILEATVVRNYSHFTGFPEKDFRLVGFLAFIAYIFVNLPSIVDLILIVDFFKTLEFSLNTSSKINMCSASFFYLAAIQYRSYVVKTVPSAPPIDPELLKLSKELENNIEMSKLIPDEYFKNIMANTYVCQTMIEVIGEREKDFCLLASKSNKDYSILEGIYELSLDIKLFNVKLGIADYESFKAYFESSEFVYYDAKTFFLTTTMRIVSRNYTAKILPFISSIKPASTALLTSFCLILVLSLILYHFLWLPYRLRHWKQYQDTLLVLNDDIINCIYIKSYFG